MGRYQLRKYFKDMITSNLRGPFGIELITLKFMNTLVPFQMMMNEIWKKLSIAILYIDNRIIL